MNDIRHFAIQADDIERARSFYSEVFGWSFEPWGPPGFYRVQTSEGALGGALQSRREWVAGQKTVGFECTIAVDDVDAVAEAVIAAGGRLLMQKSTIAGVGELIYFEDSEGNIAGAMRYDEDVD